MSERGGSYGTRDVSETVEGGTVEGGSLRKTPVLSKVTLVEIVG